MTVTKADKELLATLAQLRRAAAELWISDSPYTRLQLWHAIQQAQTVERKHRKRGRTVER